MWGRQERTHDVGRVADVGVDAADPLQVGVVRNHDLFVLRQVAVQLQHVGADVHSTAECNTQSTHWTHSHDRDATAGLSLCKSLKSPPPFCHTSKETDLAVYQCVSFLLWLLFHSFPVQCLIIFSQQSRAVSTHNRLLTKRASFKIDLLPLYQQPVTNTFSF